MSRHKLKITEYLAMFPEVEARWVNRCVTCDRIGFKPEMPDTAKGAYRVKRDLDPLSLDDVGRCAVCAKGLRPPDFLELTRHQPPAPVRECPPDEDGYVQRDDKALAA